MKYFDTWSLAYLVIGTWSCAGADPGFVERGGGAAATLFEDPLWNFKRGGGAGGARPLWPSLKTLLGISKGGGARAPCAPPESASDVYTWSLVTWPLVHLLDLHDVITDIMTFAMTWSKTNKTWSLLPDNNSVRKNKRTGAQEPPWTCALPSNLYDCAIASV